MKVLSVSTFFTDVHAKKTAAARHEGGGKEGVQPFSGYYGIIRIE